MKQNIKGEVVLKKIFALLGMLCVAACSGSPGFEARPDSFDEGQVNQFQNIKVVFIQKVSSANVIIDHKNSPAPERRGNGLLVDLVMLPVNIGGIVTTGRPVTGGARDGDVAQGVGIVYTTEYDMSSPTSRWGRSTQVGKPCEYKNGPAELVITPWNETRIQPNASCN